MSKATNQPIDIHELMARIRAETDRRRGPVTGHPGTAITSLPTVRALPKLPTITWRRSVDPKKERLDEMLRHAREKNDGNPGTPKMLRGFVRKQGVYNRILLDAVGMLVSSNAQLNKQVLELTDSFDSQTRWLEALVEHRRATTPSSLTTAQTSLEQLVAGHEERQSSGSASSKEAHDISSNS